MARGARDAPRGAWIFAVECSGVGSLHRARLARDCFWGRHTLFVMNGSSEEINVAWEDKEYAGMPLRWISCTCDAKRLVWLGWSIFPLCILLRGRKGIITSREGRFRDKRICIRGSDRRAYVKWGKNPYRAASWWNQDGSVEVMVAPRQSLKLIMRRWSGSPFWFLEWSRLRNKHWEVLSPPRVSWMLKCWTRYHRRFLFQMWARDWFDLAKWFSACTIITCL